MGSPHTFGAAAGSGSGPGAGGGPALAQRQLRTPCSVDDGGWLEDLRRLVAFASRRLRLQSFDREEIMEEAALRVQEALRRNTPSCESELRAILVMNVRRAIEDFCRAAMRRATHERLTAPAQMPQPPAPSAAVPLEEREAIGALLEPLSGRVRAVILERALLELDCREIAARHDMRHDAARKALSRAAGKVREAVGPLTGRPDEVARRQARPSEPRRARG